MRTKKSAVKRTKKAKNLSLEPDAVARGERYSRLHGTTLSRLVSDFLRSLPLEGPDEQLSPAVQRLRGLAAGGKADRAAHRDHLYRKYGGR
jgi:Family of unknown function (DUF6364)